MSAFPHLILLTVKNAFLKLAAIVLVFFISACSPKFDWREVRGSMAPFTVLLPAKPSSFSREMELGGVKLQMHMTAADADGLSFAVGCAKVDEPGKIPEVLAAMRSGMLKNIQGTSVTPGQSGGDQLEAIGTLQNGQPVKLVGRFVARGSWVYQVVVIGKEKAITPDVLDTFMTSFKTN